MGKCRVGALDARGKSHTIDDDAVYAIQKACATNLRASIDAIKKGNGDIEVAFLAHATTDGPIRRQDAKRAVCEVRPTNSQ